MKLKLLHIVSYGSSLVTPYMGKWKKINRKIKNSGMFIKQLELNEAAQFRQGMDF